MPRAIPRLTFIPAAVGIGLMPIAVAAVPAQAAAVRQHQPWLGGSGSGAAAAGRALARAGTLDGPVTGPAGAGASPRQQPPAPPGAPRDHSLAYRLLRAGVISAGVLIALLIPITIFGLAGRRRRRRAEAEAEPQASYALTERDWSRYGYAGSGQHTGHAAGQHAGSGQHTGHAGSGQHAGYAEAGHPGPGYSDADVDQLRELFAPLPPVPSVIAAGRPATRLADARYRRQLPAGGVMPRDFGQADALPEFGRTGMPLAAPTGGAYPAAEAWLAATAGPADRGMNRGRDAADPGRGLGPDLTAPAQVTRASASRPADGAPRVSGSPPWGPAPRPSTELPWVTVPAPRAGAGGRPLPAGPRDPGQAPGPAPPRRSARPAGAVPSSGSQPAARGGYRIPGRAAGPAGDAQPATAGRGRVIDGRPADPDPAFGSPQRGPAWHAEVPSQPPEPGPAGDRRPGGGAYPPAPAAVSPAEPARPDTVSHPIYVWDPQTSAEAFPGETDRVLPSASVAGRA